MRLALSLARRAYGCTSPNPMVGAVIVKGGRIIGQGWHRKAGEPHAEIEAIRDAQAKGHDPRGATLYVTLEPCSSQGRTPSCTGAVQQAVIRRLVVAAIDPNPEHCGRGLRLLRRAGLKVTQGVLEEEATRLNEAFNHWIVHRTPFVTVKAAMSLDGKIATARGESKWITGAKAREYGMHLRQGADAILVGVKTVLADNPRLTLRPVNESRATLPPPKRRIILDSMARTPLAANVVSDALADRTTIVVSSAAPAKRVKALAQRVTIWKAPTGNGYLDLRWLLRKLGRENVTHLLVEGGGGVNASFLLGGLAHRIAFFYAPKILGGRNAIKAVAGAGLLTPKEWIRLHDVEWETLGADLLLTARLDG